MELVFATQNEHKVKEVQALLPAFIQVKTLAQIGCLDDIPETENTLEGNALLKTEYVKNKFGYACFADDSGLEVAALNFEPGVFSARYAGEQRDSNDNMDLLLKNLEGKSNRAAQFRTVISLVWKGKNYQFEGLVKGEIMDKKSGIEGFGYDPIFRPIGYDKTFSEMSLEEKNRISHRGLAMQKFVDFLKHQQD